MVKVSLAEMVNRIESVTSKGVTADSLMRWSYDEVEQLYKLATRPDLRITLDRSENPAGVRVGTAYGEMTISVRDRNVKGLWINSSFYEPVGQREFDDRHQNLSLLKAYDLATDLDNVMSMTTRSASVRHNLRSKSNLRGSNARTMDTSGRRRKSIYELSLEDRAELTNQAYDALSSVNLTYESVHRELGAILSGSSVKARDIVEDAIARKVPESQLASYIVNEHPDRMSVVAALNGVPISYSGRSVGMVDIEPDDVTVAGRILKELGVEKGRYNKSINVLEVDGRIIENVPHVDERGIYHRGESSFIPYHIGYFVDPETPGQKRVHRLRHIDPVEQAIKGLKVQFEGTSDDLRMRSILDVTRDLPDFDKHPYGEEILDTLKNKLVLSKSYQDTHSIMKRLSLNAAKKEGKYVYDDGLGVVSLTMLDEDARGLIDHYGTSNNANFGMIMYLAEGAKFNDDGTFTWSQEHELSRVGQLVADPVNGSEYDNFNRHQMSFSAMLTSLDAQVITVFHGEMGLSTMDDAIVGFGNLSEKFGTDIKVGDKFEGLHGNKGVIGVMINDDLSEETIKVRHLEQLKKFHENNPDIDMVMSSTSITSRENFGIIHEGVNRGKKIDVVLNDGTVIKDGAAEFMIMRLKQTAETKTHEYEDRLLSVPGQAAGDFEHSSSSGRRFSTFARMSASAKIGDDLYNDVFINEAVLDYNVDKMGSAFHRLGIGLKDEYSGIKIGNTVDYITAENTIDGASLRLMTTKAIREQIIANLKDGQVNIKLPDGMAVRSPLLKDDDGRNGIIVNESGEAILPIRVNKVNPSDLDAWENTVRRLMETDAADSAIGVSSEVPVFDENGEFIGFEKNTNVKEAEETKPLTYEEAASMVKHPDVYGTGYSGLSYTFNDVFAALSSGSQDDLERAYYRATEPDFIQLTKKDNIIKDVKTMTFREGAGTYVIVPDPSLKLNEVRLPKHIAENERLVYLRDPAFKPSNILTSTNAGHGEDNVLMINPLNNEYLQADYDGDQAGTSLMSKMGGSDQAKDWVFYLMDPTEQVNMYGESGLSIGSAHVKAAAMAAGVDLSDLTTNTGFEKPDLIKNPDAMDAEMSFVGDWAERVREELYGENRQLSFFERRSAEVSSNHAKRAHELTLEIIDNPKAYGACAIPMGDIEAAKEGVRAIARDGIKGNLESINHRLETPYTQLENINVGFAMLAKSNMTGVAGVMPQKLISGVSSSKADMDTIRLGLDICFTQPQSVLQMKKDPNSLPIVSRNIKLLRNVLEGKIDSRGEIRQILQTVTKGYLPPEACDEFIRSVDRDQKRIMLERHDKGLPVPEYPKFGEGVINNTGLSSLALAFENSTERFTGLLNYATRKTNEIDEAEAAAERFRQSQQETRENDQVREMLGEDVMSKLDALDQLPESTVEKPGMQL